MVPQTRLDLLVTDLGDELVIYDPDTFHGHNLNKTATFIFKQCDGQATIDEIATKLSYQFGLDDGVPITLITLQQFHEQGLLQNKVELSDNVDPTLAGTLIQLREQATQLQPNAAPFTQLSRRQMLSLAGKTGIAIGLLPLITSIVAPAPAAAASGFTGFPCDRTFMPIDDGSVAADGLVPCDGLFASEPIGGPALPCTHLNMGYQRVAFNVANRQYCGHTSAQNWSAFGSSGCSVVYGDYSSDFCGYNCGIRWYIAFTSESYSNRTLTREAIAMAYGFPPIA